MAAPCFNSTLSSPINGTCANQAVGFENEALLIPLQYINRATMVYDASYPIVSTFAMSTTGKVKSVTVPGNMSFKDLKIDLKMGTFQMTGESSIIIPILDNSPAAAKQVAELANGGYCLCLKVKGYSAAAKNKYMLLGLERGIEFNAGTFQSDTRENHGWRITMKEMEASQPVCYFWDTDGETDSDTWFNTSIRA